MLDIHAARQAYKLHEISNIGFVKTNGNLADGLTKSNMQSALYSIMCTAKHEVEAEQWIIRGPYKDHIYTQLRDAHRTDLKGARYWIDVRLYLLNGRS